ncbi:MAG: hypothetical protein MUE85_04840 [Microscillaceae bacterium]|jgi:hypothetical protein|nr:hypothetical protein [Microscillaceae bacterium]
MLKHLVLLWYFNFLHHIGVHFKFTTYHPLLRRGQGEAIETRKFEMHPHIGT